MTNFKDRNGKNWTVEFDAFNLEAVSEKCGIDLADMGGDAWYKIATNAAMVGRVMCVICADQLKEERMPERNFARLVTGNSTNHARAALEAAAVDFFPESDWSAIQQQSTMLTEMAKIGPMMAMIEKLPPNLKAGVMEAIKEGAMDATDSQTSADASSATGQDDTQLTNATDEPESVEQPPAD